MRTLWWKSSPSLQLPGGSGANGNVPPRQGWPETTTVPTAVAGQYGEIHQQTCCWPPPLAERPGASRSGHQGMQEAVHLQSQNPRGCRSLGSGLGLRQWLGCVVHRCACGSTAPQLLLCKQECTNGFPAFDTTYTFCLFFSHPLSELDDSRSVLCYTEIKQRNSRDKKLLQVVFES